MGAATGPPDTGPCRSPCRRRCCPLQPARPSPLQPCSCFLCRSRLDLVCKSWRRMFQSRAFEGRTLYLRMEDIAARFDQAHGRRDLGALRLSLVRTLHHVAPSVTSVAIFPQPYRSPRERSPFEADLLLLLHSTVRLEVHEWLWPGLAALLLWGWLPRLETIALRSIQYTDPSSLQPEPAHMVEEWRAAWRDGVVPKIRELDLCEQARPPPLRRPLRRAALPDALPQALCMPGDAAPTSAGGCRWMLPATAGCTELAEGEERCLAPLTALQRLTLGAAGSRSGRAACPTRLIRPGAQAAPAHLPQELPRALAPPAVDWALEYLGDAPLDYCPLRGMQELTSMSLVDADTLEAHVPELLTLTQVRGGGGGSCVQTSSPRLPAGCGGSGGACWGCMGGVAEAWPWCACASLPPAAARAAPAES